MNTKSLRFLIVVVALMAQEWVRAGSDLGNTPVLSSPKVRFYSITLTDDAVWNFGRHSPGWQFKLKIAQDATGGHSNVWPAGVHWPDSEPPTLSTGPNRWDIIEIVDDGVNWNAAVSGLNYGACCQHALQFSGAQRVTGNNSVSLNKTFTLECWFKGPLQNVGGGWAPIVTFDDEHSGLGRNALLGYNAQFGELWFHGYGSDYPNYFLCKTPWDPSDADWHHVAGVMSNGLCLLFIDGILQSSDTYPGSGNWNGVTSPLHAAYMYSGGIDFYGVVRVDEIRLSNVPRYLSNFTPASGFKVDPDTVTYWKFNEGTGTAAADETGTHNGTLQGDPLPAWVGGK